MRITTRHPEDGTARTHVVAFDGDRPALVAAEAGAAEALQLAGAFGEGNRLQRCCICGGDEFFVRKDFPQRFGLWTVVIVGIASVTLFALRRIYLAFAVLAALVVVDMLLYAFVGRCVVCYRCRAEYRDHPIDPALRPWDLATGEKYRAGADADGAD